MSAERELFNAGVSAAFVEVCAAFKECDGTADDMFLRVRQRVERAERRRRRAETVAAMVTTVPGKS